MMRSTYLYCLLEFLLVVMLLQLCCNISESGSTYTTDRTGGPAGIVSNRDSHLVVRGSSEVGKRQSLGTHQLLRILGVSTNFLQLNSMWKKGALSSKEQRQRYKRHADEVISIPAPSEVNLLHINISAVYIRWRYPSANVPQPIQYRVQCSKNGGSYAYASSRLNITEYVYERMLMATYYQFRVVAFHGNISSEPSAPSYFFYNGQTAPPGPPIHVAAQATSSSSISLSWDPPLYAPIAVALIYNIYRGTSPELQSLHDFVTGETHKTVDGLDPDVTYFFHLDSDISGHLSIPSKTVNATTNVPDLPAVTVLSCNVSARWVNLYWSSPPAHRYPLVISNFTVYYAKLSDLPYPDATASSWFQNVTVDPSLQFWNVTGLEPSTEYVFRVRYRARTYWSKWSERLNVLTAESISCYSCRPLSSSQLIIEWKISNTSEKKSDESVRVFEIMELLSESRYLNVAEVKTSGSEYTFSYVISDLRPWTGHMYMVAQREEGPGLVDQSDPCPINSCWTREAAPSGPPKDIQIFVLSSCKINLQWAPPVPDDQNGIISDYIIVYECFPRGTWQQCDTMQVIVPSANPSLSYTFKNLEPYTEYSFEVAAMTQAGRGPFSPPSRQTTLEEPPSGPPCNITIHTITETSIELSWDPPLPWQRNGAILGYTMSYSVVKSTLTSTNVKAKSSSHSQSRPGYPLSLMKGGDDLPNTPHVTLNDESRTLETGDSSEHGINVTSPKVNITGLSAGFNYSISIAAFTIAGVGVTSSPIVVSTIDNIEIVDLNFSAQIVFPSNLAETPGLCFTLIFTWDSLPKRYANKINLTQHAVWYSINYQSDVSELKKNGTIYLSNDDAQNAQHVVPFMNASTEGISAGVRYLFLLEVYIEGTTERYKSLPAVLTTPFCPGGTLKWEWWKISVITAVGIIVLCVGLIALVSTVLCYTAIYKRRRRRHQGNRTPLIENYEPPELGENEYVYLDLRRSDGCSIASEEGDTPSPVGSSISRSLSPPSSESDQDSLGRPEEERPLLGGHPAGDSDIDDVSIHTHAADVMSTDNVSGARSLPLDAIVGGTGLAQAHPRPTPEGCSDTSSTKSLEEEMDVLDDV